MKGLVFSEFIDMVEERFGPDLTEHIIAVSELPSGGVYSSLGTYDFEELARLIKNLSEATGKEPAVLIKAFGVHLFGRLVHLYPQFLEDETSAMDFVPKVENYIHHEVRKLYPDAALPSFSIERQGPNRLTFVYQSARPLGDLAEGMLLGCAEYFGESIELNREDLPATQGHRVRFDLVRAEALAEESKPIPKGDGVPVARRKAKSAGRTVTLRESSAPLIRIGQTARRTAELAAALPPAASTVTPRVPGPTRASPAAAAVPSGAGDTSAIDRTLDYLRGLLLDRAATEYNPKRDFGELVRATADVGQTLGMLRSMLLNPTAAAPAAAVPAAAQEEIDQLKARLRRAQEARKASETIAEQKTYELYQAKSEIENTVGYLRAILENMDDGLLVVALDFEIKLVNRRAQQLFGLDGIELLGTALDQVFSERVVALVERCAKHPGPVTQRMDLSSPSGQQLSVVASSILAAESGKHIGTVMIVRDISAEVEAQKHRSITDMVVGMAHELNTPLGIIKTAVGIISEAAHSEALTGIDDDEVKEELESVIGATELIDGHTTRMGRLIDAFKKLSASQMTEAIVEVDLFELLQEIAEVMVSADERLHLAVDADLDPIDRQWVGQPDHLTQVITALLANVIEHAYPAKAETFPVKLSLARDDEHQTFRISIRDYGQGMAHDQLVRIFDPFFTSKRGGGGASPGLGLSIVHNLVTTGLRGSIEVESEVGQGTAFLVILPLRLG
ncbi:heme NO-binding domain-containing protein [Paraliomyxa miuraensis]|uniref:heme NO-binding domain-containing protein n=1 Tax=Paraliomyxa miuraensis TaxID=376150 RepID=UPI002259410F|nr:heme NO-binding domain-containing protein [Paraliomyxa miuraensis]MCX4244156.1 heme NO-binding domain-containing protein [Paraliomyxa miuraensis]